VPKKAEWTIPVLSIRYLVTKDGKTLDKEVADCDWGGGLPLGDVLKAVEQKEQDTLKALEEGSQFRGYQDKGVQGSLEYKVIDTLEIYDPMPKSTKGNPKQPCPDYAKIMELVGIKDYVEKKGVKEVWIWYPASTRIGCWESNMSSPYGDVSNSDRDPNDLPVLSKTYTVYHYNLGRESSMAVHDHLHQIEAMVDATPGAGLWEIWMGKEGAWRCGNCHCPPNAEHDYENPRYVESDIEDWKPEGFGKMKRINCNTWGRTDMGCYVYWMRSIPGKDNGLTYKGKPLTNWWALVGDYDRVRRENIGLIGR